MAIDRLSRTRLHTDLGRARLLYGEWLRCHKRRAEARDQLRLPYEMFSDAGMLGFAEHAFRELRATGETVRKRRDDTRNDLTPQEEQIARLAVEGRTNSEIGAQLYLSGRTVEMASAQGVHQAGHHLTSRAARRAIRRPASGERGAGSESEAAQPGRRLVQSDSPLGSFRGQLAGHQSPCGSVVCPTSMM